LSLGYVKIRQRAGKSSKPKTTAVVLKETKYRVVAKAMRSVKEFKFFTVKSNHPVVGANPDKPFTVLGNLIGFSTRQAVQLIEILVLVILTVCANNYDE
jgi:hypothetical protein